MPTPDSTIRLTPTQLAALVILMGEAREVTNKELDGLARFTLTGGDRKHLEDQGFIETRKLGQVLAFQLTDKGWAFCKRLHETRVDLGRSTAARAIPNVLANLRRGLDRHRISHAEFFTRGDDTGPEPTGAPDTSAGRPGAAEPADGKDPAAAATGAGAAEPAAATGATTAARLPDIEARIRAAYPLVEKGPTGFVGLADLRDHLAGLDRAAVDDALRAMARRPGVRLIPVADSASLSERDRLAALRIGGEDNHALWIGVA